MTPRETTEETSNCRKLWSRLQQSWSKKLAEATGKDIDALGHDDFQSLEEALSVFTTEGAEFDFHHPVPVNEVVELERACHQKLQPFNKTISAASQPLHVSRLIWAGLLSVIEGASKSIMDSDQRMVPPRVIKFMIELIESVPTLPEYDRTVFRSPSVQYTLQDLFGDYLHCCVSACNYFSRSTYVNILDSIFLKSKHNMITVAKESMEEHVRKLETTLNTETRRFQRQRNKEIRKMLPSDLSVMPQVEQRAESTKVNFPVNTVNKARNNAFLGRIDLLDRLERLANQDDMSSASTQSGSQEPATTSPIVANQGDIPPDSAQSGSREAAATSLTRPTICVLSGLGGMGKTQLALAYYFKYRSEYEACFWVDAEHDWGMSSTYARIADELELQPRKSTDEDGQQVRDQAIEKARSWLQKEDRRWLLIFDNVERFTDLNRYLPVESRRSSTILVTTQFAAIPSWLHCHTVPVGALDSQTAANCIFRYLNRAAKDQDEEDIARELAKHVGCLPLAMATIGGFIKQSNTSLEDFLENIKVKDSVWRKAGNIQEVGDYKKSLQTVYYKAIGALGASDKELLNVLAFLDPDFVPEQILKKAVLDGEFEHIKTEGALVECYYDLRARQLISRDTVDQCDYISIHRSVQWSVLSELSTAEPSNSKQLPNDSKRWKAFKQAFNMVKAVLPEVNPLQTPRAEDWPPYAKHGRQILELRTHCLWPEPPVTLPTSFASILIDMGTYMWFSGKFPEGEDALGTAQNVLNDNNLRPGNQLQTNIYSMRGIIKSYEGVSQRAESMKLRRDAISSRQHEMGERRTRDEDIMWWQMISDLAYAFIQEENFEETRKLMESCYEHYKTWSKDEMVYPFEYSKYYWLVSFCHLAESEMTKAVDAITQCHRLMLEAATINHPMTHLVKFCLAMILWHTQAKDLQEEALATHEAVLRWRQELLGEFSQFTLESYSTVGKLCCDANKIDRAKELLEICLERRKRGVWNVEGVTRARFRYVQVQRVLAERAGSAGKVEEAQKLRDAADRESTEINEVIKHYREEYASYMPDTDDEEANLDQMVSFWAGRFTGRLRQAPPVPEEQSS